MTEMPKSYDKFYAKREKVALQKLDKIIENFEAMKAEQQ